MKLSLFEENKKVLLVGEGNFSFAVTLAKCNLNIQLTATCYEKNVIESGKKNIEFLKNLGIRVLSHVDATKLENHEVLQFEKFDIVAFNFPHIGGKMRIEKNRDLLKNFFLSVRSILSNHGQIFLTLCDGQGGTPADIVNRKWNDSWQVTEMAAHGDFILVKVEAFDESLFDTYSVTGYRSLEKKFCTHGSITHVFKLVTRPDMENIAPTTKLSLQKHYDVNTLWKDVIDESSLSAEMSRFQGLISLYPRKYHFDITFSLNSDFNLSKLYEILYNFAGLIISNVEFVRSYQFPNLKVNETYRITYLSKFYPLHRKSIIDIHHNVIANIIEQNLGVRVSR